MTLPETDVDAVDTEDVVDATEGVVSDVVEPEDVDSILDVVGTDVDGTDVVDCADDVLSEVVTVEDDADVVEDSV